MELEAIIVNRFGRTEAFVCNFPGYFALPFSRTGNDGHRIQQATDRGTVPWLEPGQHSGRYSLECFTEPVQPVVERLVRGQPGKP